MQIENKRVVSFHYDLDEKDGARLESSRESDPIAYLHGYPGVLEALQEDLSGREAGESTVIDVPPERAYGLRRDNNVMRVPMKHINDGKSRRFRVGDLVSFNTQQGNRSATVLKVGRFNLDVDTNHPMAGKHLIFTIDIVDVREATEEELAHGHAHGPGGHQH